MNSNKIEELKRAIIVNVQDDFLDLIGKLKGTFRIDSVAGPIITAKGLTDKDRVLFHLLGVKAGKVLGVESLTSGTTTIEEIRQKLGLGNKVIRAYLSQLSRENKSFNVTKAGKGAKATYSITDFGVQFFRENILPKIKIE